MATTPKTGIDLLLDAHHEKLTRKKVDDLLSLTESLTEAVETLTDAGADYRDAERDEVSDMRETFTEAATALLALLDDWRVPEGTFTAG